MSYLKRVLVQQVQRVPGELRATTGVATDQISILVACFTLSAAEDFDKPGLQRDGREICQIRSLETLLRSAAIVTVWTRGIVKITASYVCACVCVG